MAQTLELAGEGQENLAHTHVQTAQINPVGDED